MQSQLSFSNIAVIDHATPPTSVSFPKALIIWPLAAFLGLGLEIILSLLAEALDLVAFARRKIWNSSRRPRFLAKPAAKSRACRADVGPGSPFGLGLPEIPSFQAGLARRPGPRRLQQRGSQVSARRLNISIAIVAILVATATAHALFPSRLLAERVSQSQLEAMNSKTLPGWTAVPDVRNRRAARV